MAHVLIMTFISALSRVPPQVQCDTLMLSFESWCQPGPLWPHEDSLKDMWRRWHSVPLSS